MRFPYSSAGCHWGGDRAQAQSQSVLKLAKGLASDNTTVLIGRAIVVESDRPFIEISVVNPEVADVSPLSDRSMYIFGKGRGATTLTLLGAGGVLITNVTIKVVPDIGELKQRLKEMLPNEPIDVRISGAGVVLSGVVSGKAKVEMAMRLARNYVGGSVVNMMTVGGTQQVMLKVRMAEMSLSAAKELGLDTFFEYRGSEIGAGFFSGSQSKPEPVITVGTPPHPGWGVSGDAIADAFGILGFIAELGDFGIWIALTALEEKGFSRTPAEPNLVALSGQRASFLAGQDVPIPQVSGDGEVEISFKQVGVQLDFRPVVLDDDLINLSPKTRPSSHRSPHETGQRSIIRAVGMS